MPSQPQATQNESHVFLPGSVSRNLASAAAIAKMVYEKKKRYFLCAPLRNIRMAIQPCRRAGASHSMVLSHIGMLARLLQQGRLSQTIQFVAYLPDRTDQRRLARWKRAFCHHRRRSTCNQQSKNC